MAQCRKTGISISTVAHLAFVTDHCAFIEYLPPQLCHERQRRELASEELILLSDGTKPLPVKPGVGIEGTWDVVKRYQVAGKAKAMDQRLKDKVAIITGAARRIGEAVAHGSATVTLAV